jgi:N-carbamoyl-L-amino-acid hydrolase
MPSSLPIDINRLQREIDDLALISQEPPPVVTRVLFSEADLKGRAYVKDLCRQTGLTLREDGVGNTFARWPGQDASAPAIATGSHIDAIPNAGRYDGVVGVLGGIEAIRALKQNGLRPKAALELIIFTAEEPTRFGIGCVGSRLMSGALAPEKAASLRDPDGKSLEELRAAAGFARQDLRAVRRGPGDYSAFVELHIEQGPLLELENIAIGAVERIAAPSTLRIDLTGVGGHAGAVLMPERHDALLAGAEIALAVEQAALTSGSPDTVGTTGVFRIEPGAVNSVPCRARLEIDLRDTQLATRDAALQRVKDAARDISRRRGVACQLDQLNADAPALCDSRLVQTIVNVCGDLSLPVKKMTSRAYHDSLFMAQLAPTAMIFIPCRGGVSHRPDEYASPEQIRRGVEVLALTLARLAGCA